MIQNRIMLETEVATENIWTVKRRTWCFEFFFFYVYAGCSFYSKGTKRGLFVKNTQSFWHARSFLNFCKFKLST